MSFGPFAALVLLLAPLTEADVHARLPNAEAGGEVTGWSADGRTFGVCSHTCGSRNEGWAITCSLGRLEPGATRARLRDASVADFVAAGLRLSTETLALPPGVTVENRARLDDDRCDWALRVNVGDRTARIVGDRGECFWKRLLKRSVAPGGGAVAVHIGYAADHGCGDRAGAVVAWPSGAAEALVRRGLDRHRKGKPADALPFYAAAIGLDAHYGPARYNAACAHALLGQEAEAAKHVRWLVERDGERLRKKVATDPDFDRIRARPAFVEALKGGLTTLRGVLRHTPVVPGRKSVAAYMGVEFSVETDAGRTPVAPSEAVPADALRAAADTAVEVRCEPRPDRAPHPMEQAPIGPDGVPLSRPGKCVVRALSPAK